jgi:uncharacterized protein
MNMKIALIGTTRFAGSAILTAALDRGHGVTAIIRHPEKLQKRDQLSAAAGNVHDAIRLTELLQGHEAVIGAFNPG